MWLFPVEAMLDSCSPGICKVVCMHEAVWLFSSDRSYHQEDSAWRKFACWVFSFFAEMKVNYEWKYQSCYGQVIKAHLPHSNVILFTCLMWTLTEAFDFWHDIDMILCLADIIFISFLSMVKDLSQRPSLYIWPIIQLLCDWLITWLHKLIEQRYRCLYEHVWWV